MTGSILLREELIKQDLATIGFNPTLFAGHSFRRGRASAATTAGFSNLKSSSWADHKVMHTSSI